MLAWQYFKLFLALKMVKITKEYLIKHSDGLKMQPFRRKSETDEEYLKRVTHLKLQGRYVERIGNLKQCKNVMFLYLQNNIIQTIDNMDCFTKLTHLYLQRNKIVKMENLGCMINLRKLYLGYNEIGVVEGVENLRMLRELHLEYQDLPLGETVYFDPRSVSALSACLEVLNISGNGLLSLSSLANMEHLTELLAVENKLSDLEDLGNTLKTWPRLMKINLAENPVRLERNFKDVVILSSPFLKYLDETEISQASRIFLQGWKKNKSSQKIEKTKPEVKIEGKAPLTKAVHFSQFIKAKNNEFPARNSIPAKPLTFQAWKLRKNVNSFDEKSSPRPSKVRTRRQLEETC